MDVGQMGMYLNMRLPFMVMARLGSQLLLGNGNAPNIMGLFDAGFTPNSKNLSSASQVFTSLYADLYSGMKAVGAGGGFLNPNGWIIDQGLWGHIVTQETTSAGFYYGSPRDGWAERLMGMPVRLTSATTYAVSTKLAVCADFMQYGHRNPRRFRRGHGPEY